MAPSRTNHHRIKKILVFGDSGVGKTCLNDMFVTGHHYAMYDPTLEDGARKQLVVDDTPYILELLDLNASLLREADPTFSQTFMWSTFQSADGVVLLYDITSKASFDHLTTDGFQAVITKRRSKAECGTAYPCGVQRVGFILVGNKLDLAKEKREVDEEEAREWAEAHGMPFLELDAHSQEPITSAMEVLVRSILKAEKRDDEDIAKAKGKRIERDKFSSSNDHDEDSERKSPTFKGIFQKLLVRSPT